MRDEYFYINLLITFFIFEVLYFKIADKFNIIDLPNHRSSHTSVTIRGGGILFPIAVLTWFIYSGLEFPFFVTGLLLISLVSFVDDLGHLKSGIRSFFQFIAVGLLLVETSLEIEWYFYILFFILIVGIKNAYNFMDGINGITGLYSLITLLSLWYVNRFVVVFTSESLIIITCLALLVFIFFNGRKKARCFAGDVGSVSIAFVILFILIQLLIKTENLIYVLFLLMYGLDTVSTIIFRVIRRENIFQAHRTHFYQFLANEKRWPHLRVTALYCVIQSLLNIGVIIGWSYSRTSNFGLVTLFAFVLVNAVLFIIIRFAIEGSTRLLKPVV